MTRNVNRETLSDPQRLLPIVAAAFAELGYRRATTTQLAKRCRVRENILYRAWPSKKAMFLASIEYVFDSSLRRWKQLLDDVPAEEQAAEEVLDFEAAHHGEFGLYRIVFAGLGETDDPEIRAALRKMYAQFHRFIIERIWVGGCGRGAPEPDLAAWAMIGMGTIANISRELKLFSGADRRRLFGRVGRLLLKGTSD